MEQLSYIKGKLVEALRQKAFQVMILAALMCLLKAVLKLAIGEHIHSPMITGDGSHNIGDAIEQGAAIVALLVAGLPASADYPFGRKNIESFAKLAIGSGLLALSFVFAVKCLVGVLAIWGFDNTVRQVLPLPAYEAVVLDSASFPWVVAITAGSAILSRLVGHKLISVGKSIKSGILTSSGTEIASDAKIEAVTVIGVVAEHLLGLKWLEYPLGLYVAYLIFHSGKELFLEAWGVLLQRSIGREHEDKIRELCLSVCGVVGIKRLKTFQVGGMAVVELTIFSQRDERVNRHIKKGIKQAISSYLLGDEFIEAQVTIEFCPPSPELCRVAFALTRRDGDDVYIADRLDCATHLVVCDIEEGQIMRTQEEKLPEDPGRFLVRKRVKTLFLFTPGDADRSRLQGCQVALEAAVSYHPQVLGLVV